MSEEIVFGCNLTDGKKRKFKKGSGLFDRGIKKVNTLMFDEQVKRIQELSFVRSFNPETKEVKVSLGWAGDYKIRITWWHPKVYRTDGYDDAKNPFINRNNHNLCLGTMAPTYSRCYGNHNYLECIKIAIAVLQSPDTEKTYRRWSDCGGYEKEKVYV